jgi:hypothetical protein
VGEENDYASFLSHAAFGISFRRKRPEFALSHESLKVLAMEPIE